MLLTKILVSLQLLCHHDISAHPNSSSKYLGKRSEHLVPAGAWSTIEDEAEVSKLDSVREVGESACMHVVSFVTLCLLKFGINHFFSAKKMKESEDI